MNRIAKGSIAKGDTLVLKRDNPYGFEGDDLYVEVSEVVYKPGYKTPWVRDSKGQSFRPSDFQARL